MNDTKVIKPGKKIVCFSGGHSSALAAIETARKYGTEGMILLKGGAGKWQEKRTILAASG